ncbi:S9 family peptidase, partial [Lysinibacillus sp. D4B1_S16]|uniref:alpha/beta hydrolase family protein n=1 Tax=Lysinibacillus sp. D4B1_S16 TaxID=2941231 RepID=UPI0020BF5F7A
MRRMMKRVIGGTPNRVPEAYDARTPLFEVEYITAPVLIIHGYQDENVDIEHARQLAFFLVDASKTYETWYDLHSAHQYPP